MHEEPNQAQQQADGAGEPEVQVGIPNKPGLPESPDTKRRVERAEYGYPDPPVVGYAEEVGARSKALEAGEYRASSFRDISRPKPKIPSRATLGTRVAAVRVDDECFSVNWQQGQWGGF